MAFYPNIPLLSLCSKFLFHPHILGEFRAHFPTDILHVQLYHCHWWILYVREHHGPLVEWRVFRLPRLICIIDPNMKLISSPDSVSGFFVPFPSNSNSDSTVFVPLFASEFYRRLRSGLIEISSLRDTPIKIAHSSSHSVARALSPAPSLGKDSFSLHLISK